MVLGRRNSSVELAGDEAASAVVDEAGINSATCSTQSPDAGARMAAPERRGSGTLPGRVRGLGLLPVELGPPATGPNLSEELRSMRDEERY